MRWKFEYVRHGTASLIAAMDVATGKVTATDISRDNSVAFIAFLEEIDKSIDDDLVIHIVMDNGSSHTSKATKGWLAEHPRFVIHYTPVHASWLNQVEAFFSILTRRLLRRGAFESRQDLVDKMLAFIDHHSTTTAPFKRVHDAKAKAAWSTFNELPRGTTSQQGADAGPTLPRSAPGTHPALARGRVGRLLLPRWPRAAEAVLRVMCGTHVVTPKATESSSDDDVGPPAPTTWLVH